MKHLGDIRAISGYSIPPVDVVTGGSPCQDLSIAGRREGLAGERSALFLEQIRVVKELRNADRERGRTGELIRPRFMVWENVPGAFSSSQRQDFRAVLEACIRVAQPDAPDVPLPEKWPLADAWYGYGWSLAYRVFDAQFWGVPQRRRRIALVCDFGGHAAPEVLFIRKSVSGDSEPCGAAGKDPAGDFAPCAYPSIARGLTARNDGSPCLDRGPNIVVQNAVKCLNPWDAQSARIYDESGKWHSMNANESGGMQRDAVFCLQGNGIDRADTAGCNGKGWKENVSYTLNTVDRHAVYDARGNGGGETVCTLTGDHANRVTDYTPLVATTQGYGDYAITGTARTIRAGHDINSGDLVCTSAVRRLTPLECERLQGFPDGWTDIGVWTDSKGRVRETSDAARYKSLGNSIALPPWKWVLKRIAAQYERDATLGSLFDGIGGFPLIWEQFNGRGSTLWASEIEEFPMAVTRRHFGET